MRCQSCDCILTDFESTQKYEYGEYIELCFDCLRASEIEVTDDRIDLLFTDGEEDDYT